MGPTSDIRAVCCWARRDSWAFEKWYCRTILPCRYRNSWIQPTFSRSSAIRLPASPQKASNSASLTFGLLSTVRAFSCLRRPLEVRLNVCRSTRLQGCSQLDQQRTWGFLLLLLLLLLTTTASGKRDIQFCRRRNDSRNSRLVLADLQPGASWLGRVSPPSFCHWFLLLYLFPTFRCFPTPYLPHLWFELALLWQEVVLRRLHNTQSSPFILPHSHVRHTDRRGCRCCCWRYDRSFPPFSTTFALLQLLLLPSPPVTPPSSL